jgi:DNA end-binding protein Ku
LRDPARLRVPAEGRKALGIPERELQMAERLIDEMTGEWDPSRYHDEYQEELLAFVKKRGRAGRVAEAPETAEEEAAPRRADIIDIAELLKRSLAGKGEGRRRSRPRRRKAS